MSGDRCMIYGAYGYTGELAVREARAFGLEPVLSGRDAARLEASADKWGRGMELRAVGLDDDAALDAALHDVGVVLHCAGPFSATSRPMARACLRTGTHYLDITGEMAVFEALARQDGEAKDAGVMLLPGIGFDVVPTDCMAARLAAKLPGATHLELAFAGLGGGTSQGTQKTAVQNLHRGGAIRVDGAIKIVPPAWRTREIDFGDGKPRLAVSIPWGDVSTAFQSTKIPNITAYMAAPPKLVRAMKLARLIRPVLGLGPVQSFLRGRVEAGPRGPSDERREGGVSLVWGEVRDADGNTASDTLKTIEGYTLTARSGLLAATKVLAGGAKPGFQTPSMAFGADYVLEIEGSSWGSTPPPSA